MSIINPNQPVNEISIEQMKINGFVKDENKETPEVDDYTKRMIQGIDGIIERTKKESIEYQQQRHENLENADIDEEGNNKEKDKVNTDNKDDEEEDIKKEYVKSSIFDIDEKDLDDDEIDEEENTDKRKQRMDKLQTAIKEKINPISNVIDLSQFTVSKTPVSVLTALKASGNTKINVIDWVLPASGRSISMSEFKAYDIEKINPQSSSRNRLNTYRDIYEIIYEHVIDANKPDFEVWLKSINFQDLNHLFFAIFQAAFAKNNEFPYNCPKCEEVFLKELAIKDMIKYKDDTVKELVMQLLNRDTTTETVEYETPLIQVSDSYVIGFKEPSIYDVIFENAILDEKFTSKYNDMLSILSYIDCIYLINRDTMKLDPIEIKVEKDNAVKTIKNKIRKYTQILKTLNSDQSYIIEDFIHKVEVKHDIIDYMLPAAKCPKCGTEIPEVIQSASSLLFMRHRLRAIANMSIE